MLGRGEGADRVRAYGQQQRGIEGGQMVDHHDIRWLGGNVLQPDVLPMGDQAEEDVDGGAQNALSQGCPLDRLLSRDATQRDDVKIGGDVTVKVE